MEGRERNLNFFRILRFYFLVEGSGIMWFVVVMLVLEVGGRVEGDKSFFFVIFFLWCMEGLSIEKCFFFNIFFYGDKWK